MKQNKKNKNKHLSMNTNNNSNPHKATLTKTAATITKTSAAKAKTASSAISFGGIHGHSIKSPMTTSSSFKQKQVKDLFQDVVIKQGVEEQLLIISSTSDS